MKIPDLRDASDSVSDLAAASRRYVSDVSLPDVSRPDVSIPDVSLSDALDDVADLAGDAVEMAGDVAAVVVAQSGRGLAQIIRTVRKNPAATAGVVAVIVLIVALVAAKRRSSDEPSFEAIS